MRRFLAAVLLVLSACASQQRVIVAAGTTLVDSGLLDAVALEYEAEHPGVEISVVGEATARVLDLGRRGGADVLITHAPQLEAAFVADGLADVYELALLSSFVIVGPDGTGLGGTASEVFREIAARQMPFVSRADGSGTHETEVRLWSAAGIDPNGEDWYLETGQGMGLTLQVADQRDAVTLSETGTFLAARSSLSLIEVPATGLPENPYHVIVVADSPDVGAARDFVEWLLSDEGRETIVDLNRRLFGRQVYSPAP